jgi:Glucose / Sorbosone dehydrogenase/Dockerin type I domain
MHDSVKRMLFVAVAALLGGTSYGPSLASAQDLLNDNPQFSSFNLELRPYVTMPANQNNIISMTTRIGDPRLYVTTQQGSIFVVNQNPNGTGTPTLFFNATDTSAGGVAMTSGSGTSVNQHGLQSIAFHPDFDHPGTPGYGKMYATMVRTHLDGANFLGNSPHGGVSVFNPAGNPDGVLAEWTYNHDTGAFGGYRELFRVNMPVDDHPIKQARFNPYAQPGDEDYGLLYMTHGDSNTQQSTEDYPQFLDNVLGKMIRINPLQNGADPYTIPTTNPFYDYSGPTPTAPEFPADHPTVLGEIYAYGFRNPHTFSFSRDDAGHVDILAGNIGRSNVEEVNLVLPGQNYGWPNREGTFIERQGTVTSGPNPNAGYISGVLPLPDNEASLTDGYGNANVYPVAQYDHNANVSQINSGNSIASGFVIRNASDPNLYNQLIFNNFPTHDGTVYHTDFDEMLNAVTTLDPNDPARDEPSELTQALLHKLHLALDDDNNPATPAIIYDDFSTLISGNPASTSDRNDARYGEGVFGEMYISSKQGGGRIYLVTNSVPQLGDYNQDRVVDAADYTIWRDTINSTGYHLAADGNGDGTIDDADYLVWKDHFGETWGSAGSGASSLSIPEPATAVLAALALALLSVARSARRHTTDRSVSG